MAAVTCKGSATELSVRHPDHRSKRSKRPKRRVDSPMQQDLRIAGATWGILDSPWPSLPCRRVRFVERTRGPLPQALRTTGATGSCSSRVSAAPQIVRTVGSEPRGKFGSSCEMPHRVIGGISGLGVIFPSGQRGPHAASDMALQRRLATALCYRRQGLFSNRAGGGPPSLLLNFRCRFCTGEARVTGRFWIVSEGIAREPRASHTL